MIWVQEWEFAAMNGQLFLFTPDFIYPLSMPIIQFSEIHGQHKNLKSNCRFMNFGWLLMEAVIAVLWVCGFLQPSLEKCGIEGRIRGRGLAWSVLFHGMKMRLLLGRFYPISFYPMRLDKTKLMGTLGSLRKDKFSLLCFINMIMFIWASVYKHLTIFNIYL